MYGTFLSDGVLSTLRILDDKSVIVTYLEASVSHENLLEILFIQPFPDLLTQACWTSRELCFNVILKGIFWKTIILLSCVWYICMCTWPMYGVERPTFTHSVLSTLTWVMGEGASNRLSDSHSKFFYLLSRRSGQWTWFLKDSDSFNMF